MCRVHHAFSFFSQSHRAFLEFLPQRNHVVVQLLLLHGLPCVQGRQRVKLQTNVLRLFVVGHGVLNEFFFEQQTLRVSMLFDFLQDKQSIAGFARVVGLVQFHQIVGPCLQTVVVLHRKRPTLSFSAVVVLLPPAFLLLRLIRLILFIHLHQTIQSGLCHGTNVIHQVRLTLTTVPIFLQCFDVPPSSLHFVHPRPILSVAIHVTHSNLGHPSTQSSLFSFCFVLQRVCFCFCFVLFFFGPGTKQSVFLFRLRRRATVCAMQQVVRVDDLFPQQQAPYGLCFGHPCFHFKTPDRFVHP